MTQYQWADDPEVMRARVAAKVRRGLWINTLIWMPLFLAFLALSIYYIAGRIMDFETGGTGFLFYLVIGLAILFGFQGFQSVLDLLGSPKEQEGFVTRRWSRSDSFVIKSHYIRLDKQILRIERAYHGDIVEGDYLRVVFYPHSAVVIHVERVAAPEGERYVPARPATPPRR